MVRRVPTAALADLARLPSRGRNDHYLGAPRGIVSKRASGTEGLIVGMSEHAEQAAMASQEHSPVGSPRSAWLRSVYPRHPYYLRPGSVRLVGDPTLPTTSELNTNGTLPGGARARGVDQA